MYKVKLKGEVMEPPDGTEHYHAYNYIGIKCTVALIRRVFY